MEYKLKEFCRLTGLTRKALLIYEDKDILSPHRVDESTGYRYYSEEELILGTKVALLRSLSMNVEEIFEALHTPGAVYALLKKHEHDLWLDYQQRSHSLFISTMNAVQNFTLNQNIKTESLYYDQIVSLEGRGTTRDIGLHFNLLHRHCYNYGYYLVDAPFTWYFADSSKESLHFKVCYPIKEPWTEQSGGIKMEYLGRFTVAAMRHFGSYELLPLSYTKLKTYCKKVGHVPTGEYIEIYRTTSLKSTIKDTTTLITDIGALL